MKSTPSSRPTIVNGRSELASAIADTEPMTLRFGRSTRPSARTCTIKPCRLPVTTLVIFGILSKTNEVTAAKSLGIKVYTIGMGRPGEVPVPTTDVFGRERVVYQESVLDEETLREIADITGGRYYRAFDTAELGQIYDEINSLEQSQIEMESYTRYRELAGLLLVPALLIFLIEMVLRRTVLRKLP